jgi:hypothetical protein
MDTLLSICIGIGLSAACGFRVFVPPLVMSMASIFGHLTLSPNFGWMGTYPALVVFAVATCIEIAAYYIPWVDHLLDIVATPMAIAAGTVVTASLLPDADSDVAVDCRTNCRRWFSGYDSSVFGNGAFGFNLNDGGTG